MKLIKLTKVADCTDASHTDNYPVDTLRTGYLHNEIKVDECIVITKDGGGFFMTSTVRELLTDNRVKTINSIYQIEYLG